MKEASSPEYFVDGYMLKHFGVWPHGMDKDNLFYEQKVFIMYLMGTVPSHDDWSIQVDYKNKMQAIKDLTIKDIDIDQSDIDVAKLQGRNIAELKKDRLRAEKKKRIDEINQKFGIKTDTKPERPQGLPEMVVGEEVKRQELWDMLQGKGLVESENA